MNVCKGSVPCFPDASKALRIGVLHNRFFLDLAKLEKINSERCYSGQKNEEEMNLHFILVVCTLD